MTMSCLHLSLTHTTDSSDFILLLKQLLYIFASLKREKIKVIQISYPLSNFARKINMKFLAARFYIY